MNAEFEKYASEQLSSYEMSVDTDALWADVSAQIRPTNPKRRGGLWFFLLGITVGLSLVGLFFINKNNTYTEVSTTVVNETTNSTNSEKKSSIIPVAKDESSNQELKENSKNSTNDPLLNEASIVNINTTKDASATKNTSIASAKYNKSVPPQLSGNDSNFPPILKNTSTTDTRQNSTTILKESSAASISTIVLDARKQYQAANVLPTLSPGFLYSDKDLPPEFLVGFKSLSADFAKKDFGKKSRRRGAFFRGLRFGVGLYGGISRSNADLEAKNESAQSLLISRTNSEKQLETLHLGLNAIIQSEQNFYFRTGIEYTRIASLFSRESQRIEMDSIPGIVEIQINGITGERDTIFGDVLVTRTTDFTKKSYNYFHLVDVPVIFGYNFGDDPWRIGVEAGIFANVFIRNKGDIGLETDAFYDIGEDAEGWYKDNIGISPYVGINAAYNVSENIQIHLTPSFRFNSVFSTAANPLKQQYGNLGVRAGVRYIFD